MRTGNVRPARFLAWLPRRTPAPAAPATASWWSAAAWPLPGWCGTWRPGTAAPSWTMRRTARRTPRWTSPSSARSARPVQPGAARGGPRRPVRPRCRSPCPPVHRPLARGVRAVRHRPRGRGEVSCDDGRRVPYDTLVLATGSNPVLPPLRGLFEPDGHELPAGVHAFRTMDDCLALADAVRPGLRAVVIGGGLLGCPRPARWPAAARRSCSPSRASTSWSGSSTRRGTPAAAGIWRSWTWRCTPSAGSAGC